MWHTYIVHCPDEGSDLALRMSTVTEMDYSYCVYVQELHNYGFMYIYTVVLHTEKNYMCENGCTVFMFNICITG